MWECNISCGSVILHVWNRFHVGVSVGENGCFWCTAPPQFLRWSWWAFPNPKGEVIPMEISLLRLAELDYVPRIWKKYFFSFLVRKCYFLLFWAFWTLRTKLFTQNCTFKQCIVIFHNIYPFWYGKFIFSTENFIFGKENIPGTGITQNLRPAECKLWNLHSNSSPTICAQLCAQFCAQLGTNFLKLGTFWAHFMRVSFKTKKNGSFFQF